MINEYDRVMTLSGPVSLYRGKSLGNPPTLRIILNIDGVPVAASVASRSHTHPSHSKTSRLLTSSLSLGVPVPRTTQCMRGV